MMRRAWKCQNCGTESYHSEDELPAGWRWFGLCETLEGHFDELECPLLCRLCVAALDDVLKQARERGPVSLES